MPHKGRLSHPATQTVQVSREYEYIDVLDENGDTLIRVGVGPDDEYHRKHGRVNLGFFSKDVSSYFHWSPYE